MSDKCYKALNFEFLKQELISTYNIDGKSKDLVNGKDNAKEESDTK